MSGALNNNAGPVPGWNAQSSSGGNQSLVKAAAAVSPYLEVANNLSDVASAATSLTNLGAQGAITPMTAVTEPTAASSGYVQATAETAVTAIDDLITGLTTQGLMA